MLEQYPQKVKYVFKHFPLRNHRFAKPAALASMAAKYVRELLMLRLNRFFQDRLPQLKPTAGYHGDARRYVTEIKPVMEQLGVSRSELVRSA